MQITTYLLLAVARSVLAGCIKKQQFDYNRQFVTDVFSQKFDFIVAQSISSHAGSDLISIALDNFRKSLKPNGLIAVTFREGIKDFDGTGWLYPGCVSYRHSTIKRFAKEAGLFISRIPWYHPSQTWYLLAKDRSRLLNNAALRYMSGVVLFDQEFVASWNIDQKIIRVTKNYVLQILPRPIKNGLKKIVVSRKSHQ